MKIVIGSTDKVKLAVVKKILPRFLIDRPFKIIKYKSHSYSSSILYDQDIVRKAHDDAWEALKSKPLSDYSIGIESGIVERYGGLYEESWAVILTKDNQQFIGYSSGFKIPHYVLRKLRGSDKKYSSFMEHLNKELGLTKDETWGAYSGGIIFRQESFEEALRNAIVHCFPHKESLYRF